MAPLLDPKVVALGAAIQIGVAVPTAVLVSAARQDDLGADSNLWLVGAFLILVVGPAAAGAFVGRRRPDSPMLHAATATGTAWALLTAVSLVRAALAGDELVPLLLILLTIAPIQIGIGVLGTFFSRPRRQPEETL